MARPDSRSLQGPRRRAVLQQAGALGALAAVAPHALAQADDLAPYRAAKINWRQAEGEQITVAVIPAGPPPTTIRSCTRFSSESPARLPAGRRCPDPGSNGDNGRLLAFPASRLAGHRLGGRS